MNKMILTTIHETDIPVYLIVLMVAIPFSTVSGVLLGSWDPSLGAIFVAGFLTMKYLPESEDEDEMIVCRI